MNYKGFHQLQWEDRLVIEKMLKVGDSKAKIAEAPVSYTHLDVYKRQDIVLGARKGHHGAHSKPRSGLFILAGRGCLPAAGGRRGGPVSYTHLDVYKRQAYQHVRERCLSL